MVPLESLICDLELDANHQTELQGQLYGHALVEEALATSTKTSCLCPPGLWVKLLEVTLEDLCIIEKPCLCMVSIHLLHLEDKFSF